jgi:hypothetical protein
MSLVKRKMRFRILGMVAVIVLVVAATHAGSVLVVNAPERSDVIVVLAGETDHRPARALQLLDQGYGQRVLVDVPAEASVFGFSEVQLAAQYAHQVPEAASVRICPIVGLSTRDESHDAAKCLESEQIETKQSKDGPPVRVLIVTSDFHTRRALSIFQHELPGRKFSVAASYDDAQFGTNWWTHRQWAKTCLEEWTKVFWWNAVDRWRK